MRIQACLQPAFPTYAPARGLGSTAPDLALAPTAAPAATTPGIAPLPSDTASLLSTTPATVATPTLNKGEMLARYASDFAIHLGMSDVPAGLSITANLAPLPPTFGPLLQLCNAANTFTSLAAAATDLREIRGSQHNPHATRLDRAMDIGHLVVGDVVATVAGAVPMVASLNNPWAMGLFVGGQALGIAADVAKTAYDIHRKGQQSA